MHGTIEGPRRVPTEADEGPNIRGLRGKGGTQAAVVVPERQRFAGRYVISGQVLFGQVSVRVEMTVIDCGVPVRSSHWGKGGLAGGPNDPVANRSVSSNLVKFWTIVFKSICEVSCNFPPHVVFIFSRFLMFSLFLVLRKLSWCNSDRPYLRKFYRQNCEYIPVFGPQMLKYCKKRPIVGNSKSFFWSSNIAKLSLQLRKLSRYSCTWLSPKLLYTPAAQIVIVAAILFY